MTTTIMPRERKHQSLGTVESLAYFGIPALLLFLGVHGIMPWFNDRFATPPFYGYFVGIILPLAGMLVAAHIALWREGIPLTVPSIRHRFRLHPMDRKAWIWTGITVIGAFLLTGLFSVLNGLLIAQGLIDAPDWLPAFLAPAHAQMDGNGSLFTVYDAAFGGLVGNWQILGIYLLLLFFNIFGEELWWRGYLLPRQELALGGHTWLVHGLLWWAFHAFKWWDILPILPVTLLISYVAQRTQNTMPGIISHSIFNGVALIPILLGILGQLS